MYVRLILVQETRQVCRLIPLQPRQRKILLGKGHARRLTSRLRRSCSQTKMMEAQLTRALQLRLVQARMLSCRGRDVCLLSTRLQLVLLLCDHLLPASPFVV